MKKNDSKIIFSLKWLAFLGLILGSLNASAQKVSFSATAPKVVSVGERFRLVFKANAQGTTLSPGKMDGFSVLSGPSTSQSMSTQIVNGQMQQTFEVSYTYILQAQKEGKFTLGPGRLAVEGKNYTSNRVTIEVVASQNPNQGGNNPNSGGRANPAPGNNPSNASINNSDLFLRTVVSKREVLKGEPIVATFKIYSRVNLRQAGGLKTPSFNGFWSERLFEASNFDFQRENVNGQPYNVAVLSRYVLIPERTGELTIGSGELTGYVQVRVQGRSRSVFDQVFGSYKNVEKQLISPEIKIKVNPLPGKAPVGFSDAVGNINLSATLEPAETKTNEPISLKVSYSGSGNLKLLAEPNIKFPSDFEVYDPKISNNFRAGASGFTGKKTFEYLIIPRHEGEYEIPQIQFSAFDLNSNSYKSQSAGPFTVKVAKGEGGTMTAIDLGNLKEDVQVLGSDIHYIRTTDFELREKARPFFGSASFYLSYLLALGAFSLIFLFLQRKRRQSEDLVFMKNKKAGKVAQSRLKQAKQFLDQGERSGFYKEVLNALWGYLSDKLNISQGKLDKQKAKEGLASRNVEASVVEHWMDLMNRCEYAQFAPGEGEDELTKVYDETAQLIGDLEKAMSR